MFFLDFDQNSNSAKKPRGTPYVWLKKKMWFQFAKPTLNNSDKTWGSRVN